MASKLKELGMKTKRSTTQTISQETKNDKPPEGSKIIEQTVRTETEEIENGWLVTKSFNGRYIAKGSEDKYGNYFNYSLKWYSKEDPLTVTVNDASLAEAFED